MGALSTHNARADACAVARRVVIPRRDKVFRRNVKAAVQADIWGHALRQLRVRPKEASLVLTEPPMPLAPIQELTDQARRTRLCSQGIRREQCSSWRPPFMGTLRAALQHSILQMTAVVTGLQKGHSASLSGSGIRAQAMSYSAMSKQQRSVDGGIASRDTGC